MQEKSGVAEISLTFADQTLGLGIEVYPRKRSVFFSIHKDASAHQTMQL